MRGMEVDRHRGHRRRLDRCRRRPAARRPASPERGHAVAHPRRRRRRRAPLDIVCGAQNLAVGQLVPVARVGRRAARRSPHRALEDPRRGRATACCAAPPSSGSASDADGIHILGTDDEHPLGTDLRTHLRRDGARRRRQAEPWRRAVDDRPRARDRRLHGRRSAVAGRDGRRVGGADERPRHRADRGVGALLALRRALVRWRRERSVAGLDAAAPASPRACGRSARSST